MSSQLSVLFCLNSSVKFEGLHFKVQEYDSFEVRCCDVSSFCCVFIKSHHDVSMSVLNEVCCRGYIEGVKGEGEGDLICIVLSSYHPPPLVLPGWYVYNSMYVKIKGKGGA